MYRSMEMGIWMQGKQVGREMATWLEYVCGWTWDAHLSPFPSFDAREALGTSFPRESLSVSSEQVPGPACREEFLVLLPLDLWLWFIAN